MSFLGLFPSKRDRFVRQMQAALRARGWSADYDPVTFSISVDGEGGLPLQNVFAYWLQGSRSERLDLIRRTVEMHAESQEVPAYEAVAGRLLPALRRRVVAEQLVVDPTGTLEDTEPIPMRPFAGDLVTLVVVDRPHSMSYVRGSDLRTWERSFDEICETALANLRAKDGFGFEEMANGLWVSNGAEPYDPSWLLVPGFIAKLDVKGDPVAVPVSRFCVVVAGSDDGAALRAMGEFVDEALRDEPYPISDAPLVLQDGEWRTFEQGLAGAL